MPRFLRFTAVLAVSAAGSRCLRRGEDDLLRRQLRAPALHARKPRELRASHRARLHRPSGWKLQIDRRWQTTSGGDCSRWRSPASGADRRRSGCGRTCSHREANRFYSRQCNTPLTVSITFSRYFDARSTPMANRSSETCIGAGFCSFSTNAATRPARIASGTDAGWRQGHADFARAQR